MKGMIVFQHLMRDLLLYVQIVSSIQDFILTTNKTCRPVRRFSLVVVRTGNGSIRIVTVDRCVEHPYLPGEKKTKNWQATR